MINKRQNLNFEGTMEHIIRKEDGRFADRKAHPLAL
jgi:hypothetical protein